jgi:DNA-binding HxlR family transcriptional regulator
MTQIKEASTNFENKTSLAKKCTGIYAFNIIGGQWSLAICCYLAENTLRFGELRKLLPNISERMLTLHLRKLEDNKLLIRTIYPEVPPRVDYQLTESGRALIPILQSLKAWGITHQEAIVK